MLIDYLDLILSIRDDWAQYAMVKAKLSLMKNTTCPNEGSHWGLKRDGFINDQADIDVVVKSDIAKVSILSYERTREGSLLVSEFGVLCCVVLCCVVLCCVVLCCVVLCCIIM